MKSIFLLQNQDMLFLSKQLEWVDGGEPTTLYQTQHKDEAVNQAFEANTRDYSQRIRVLECACDSRGLPQLDSEDQPAPATRSSDDRESGPAARCAQRHPS